MLLQRGFSQIIILIILVIGLVVGLIVVQNRTQLFPKANEDSPPAADSIPQPQLEPIDTTNNIPGQTTIQGNIIVDGDTKKFLQTATGIEVFGPRMAKQTNKIVTSDQQGHWTMTFDVPQDINNCVGNCFSVSLGQLPSGWKVVGSSTLDINRDENGNIINSQPYNFHIVGTNTLSGIVDAGVASSTNASPPVMIILDYSNANNIWTPGKLPSVKLPVFTYTPVNRDGTFSFDNLPPFSSFKVKATTACPYKINAPQTYTSNTPLGAENGTGYVFDLSLDLECATSN